MVSNSSLAFGGYGGFYALLNLRVERSSAAAKKKGVSGMLRSREQLKLKIAIDDARILRSVEPREKHR